MVDEKITIQDAAEVDPNLLRILDRGLEDIEAGRTLPHDEAMAEVRRIREARRLAVIIGFIQEPGFTIERN